MKNQFDSHTATAVAFLPEADRLFSEFGFSATFFDLMPVEILLVNVSGETLAANERYRNRFGETLGKQWQDLLENSRAEIDAHLQTVAKQGFHNFSAVYRNNRETGPGFRIEAFRLEGGKPRIALIHRQPAAVSHEFWIGPKKTAANTSTTLPGKTGSYKVFESAELPVIVADENDRIVFANNSSANYFGLDENTLKTLRSADLILPAEANSVKTGFTGFLTQFRLRKSDGTETWAEITELPGLENERILLLNDVSKRRSELSRLFSAYEFYRIFADQSEHEIVRFDLSEGTPTGLAADIQSGLIIENSQFHESSLLQGEPGAPPVFKAGGTSFSEYFGSRTAAFAIAMQFVESGYRLLRKETVETSRDGKESFYITSLNGVVEDDKLTKIWISRRDVTLRKQAERAYLVAEDQLRQSQKIEPIGRLAGGIAHDFNNFLAVIMLQVEMMSEELDPASPLRRRIGEIKTVTDKAANMVKQLLAFGRKQTMRPHHLSLNEVIEEFIKMTRSLIGEDIEIRLETASDLGMCFVDPNQMTQILMNLAINAKDAMPDGGILRIKTSNLEIDENTFKHRAQHKGEYIELLVEDNGHGMDQATQKHVFEPFFTTKEGSKGTGLGLATVYGIVKQSKGFIWVDSKPEEGTTFRVQFPRTDSGAAAAKMQRTSKIPRGTETILLVEDEDLIRTTSVEVLRSLGYTILEAKNGENAVRMAANHGDGISLLLTDVVMPKMNGRDLADAVRQTHPDISVLFMSGYADDVITRHGILEDDVHFLGKPFTPLTLAATVRKAIGSR